MFPRKCNKKIFNKLNKQQNYVNYKMFVLAAGGIKGGYDEDTLMALAKIAKTYSVKKIIIESNFGDGMFTNIFTPVLTRVYPCTIEEVRHNVQKERRIIDTLEPVMNQHRLIVDIGVVRADLKYYMEDPEKNARYSLFYQMTRLTKERGALKHDDRLDAVSMAVQYWVNAMKRDDHKAAEAHQDRLLKAELRNFMKNAITMPGGMTKGPQRSLITFR